MTEQGMLQINKQILQLAMQQDDLNTVLGNMLSTAECLANRFGINPKQSYFENYNMYGSGNTKNEEDLKFQLQIQTKVFRNNHNYMLNKEGKYPFPDNLGKKEIENLAKYWKNNAKPENKIYFDNIIKILNGNYNLIFPEKKYTSNGIDPNVTLELFPQVMKDVDKNRKKVKEEVSKSGSYNNNLKLDEKSPNTAPRNFGSKKIDIFEEEGMNFIQYLSDIFKNIELYLYHSYLKNKINPNLIYGKKAEYEKINPNGISSYLKNELELLKQKYAEYCSYDDTSKMKEIKKYQKSCQKWMETYQNDFIINTLGDILLGKPQETKKGFLSSFFN